MVVKKSKEENLKFDKRKSFQIWKQQEKKNMAIYKTMYIKLI